MIEWISKYSQEIIIITTIIIALLVLPPLFWKKSLIITHKFKTSLKRKLGVYYLPETVIEVKVNSTVLIIQNTSKMEMDATLVGQEFILSTKVQPDITQAFALTHVANPYSINDFVLETNDKGLLENMKASSDSQAPEIFSFLSDAPAQIAGKHFNLTVEDDTHTQLNKKIEIKHYEKAFYIRLTDLIKSTSGSIEKTWKIEVIPSSSNKLLKMIDADFTIKGKRINSSFQAKEPQENSDGLLFRLRSLFKLDLSSNNPKTDPHEFRLNCIDPEFCYNVPIKSTPFVKRTHELTMLNGELVSHKLTIPSAVEGFISIPINIAKAIVSIPSQILSLRIDYTTKKKKLEEITQSLKEIEMKDSNIDTKKTMEESIMMNERELLNTQKELTRAESELAEIKIQYAMDLERLEHTNKELNDKLKEH